MASLKRFATLGSAAAAATTDPQFNLTTLLLHGDGTNGAQNNTFVDSSTNNFTITRNGNTTQGTFTPFSQTGWSNFFAGTTGSALTTPAGSSFAYGTGNFTLEAWIFVTAGSKYQIIYSQTDATLVYYFYLGLSNTNTLRFIYSTTITVETTATVPLNQWVHVAAVREGTGTNQFKLYINGAAQKTGTVNFDFSNTTRLPCIGTFSHSVNAENFTGYISNLRVVKGTAVYTSDFSPPTAPLTAITNTVLLTCQDNRFKDNSSNNLTLTVNGTPSVQAFSSFAPTSAYSTSVVGGSGYFDGTGDYLSMADNAALRFGTSAFTIQAWVYRSVAGVAHSIIAKGTSTTGYVLQITSTNVLRFTHSSTNVDTTTTIPAGTWTHVAAVRTGTGTNGFQLYINGVSAVTATVATDFSQTDTLYVGADRLAANAMNGYISGLRYVVGTAETITIPTAPPSPTGAAICANFTNAGIIDNTAKNDLETVGTAQISTAVKKFGSGSLAFDSGGYLTLPNSPITQLGTGDFTIEGWVYFNEIGFNVKGIIGKGSGTTGWVLVGDDTSVLRVTYSSTVLLGATTLVINTWYHFAVVRSGTATGNLKIYLNGVLDATSPTAVTTNFNQTNPTYIGANRTGVTLLNGYIDDLRITKYARYTANFTPPTAAFPDQ